MHHELEQQVEQLRADLRLSKAIDVQAGVKRNRGVNLATKRSAKARQTYANAKMMRTQEANGSSAETLVDIESSEQPGGCKLIQEILTLCS
jgi:hypothetical protein